MSSYPTYEEWKPNSTNSCNLLNNFSFLSYLWGMETLYYKSCILRLIDISFLSYLWGMETSLDNLNRRNRSGSYPTYEEWKLQSKGYYPKEEIRFLSYLWGMETRYRIWSFENSLEVLILPMRNGNRHRYSPTSQPSQQHVLILPMRNGNQILQ